MPQWSTSARVETLRQKYLPVLGYRWQEPPARFVEVMRQAIELMPDPVRTAMRRYYVLGDTQSQDEVGRPLREDRSFYNHLITGRTALVTSLRMREELRG